MLTSENDRRDIFIGGDSGIPGKNLSAPLREWNLRLYAIKLGSCFFK